MNKKLIIKPLEGLGNLKFGTTKQDVENYLGKPQDTEVIEVAENELSDAIVWNYDDQGISAFFEKDHNDLLTCFDIRNDNVVLFGKKVFDLKMEQIIDLMNKNGFSDIESEDEDWGEQRLSFNDAVIDFYFNDQTLTSISWSVMLDENNNIEWPE